MLLIHRNARADDHALGKFNGLGGKIERDEDAAAGMIRELREEAGIEATSLSLRGTISWPGFGKNGEDWLAFVFVVTAFTGDVNRANPEARSTGNRSRRFWTAPFRSGRATGTSFRWSSTATRARFTA